MPSGPEAIRRVARVMDIPWRSASYIAGLLRAGSDGRLWVPGGGGIRAQVQPGHLVALLAGIAGSSLGTPAEACATVQLLLGLRRDVLTLTPEGKVMPVQVETGEHEATPLGDILLPTLGATLERLVDHLAGPMPEELRSDIGGTLSVELQPGRMPTACVRFAEPGIGVFRCRYAAPELGDSLAPETALRRTVEIPGALLLELGAIWADSQSSLATRPVRSDVGLDAMPVPAWETEDAVLPWSGPL